MKLRGPTEDQIQRAVVRHLDICGVPDVVYWHTPNGGSRNVIEAAKFKGLGVKPGIPDVLAVRGGQLYALELKRDKGRLSDHQKAMLCTLGLAGAVTGVAYGLDEALEHLRAWGLLK